MAKTPVDPSTLDLETLMAVAEQRFAHFTLLNFSTHWKAVADTPDLDGGKGRAQVKALTGYPTAQEAMFALITAKDEPQDEE